jgi:hypothetical protein
MTNTDNDQEQAFPIELLDASKGEKANYFRNFIFGHYLFQQAYEEIIEFLDYETDTNILMVIGPFRAGKSTLLRKTEEKLITKHVTERDNNPGWLPIISWVVPIVDKKFDSRQYYIHGLKALSDVLIDKKVGYVEGSVEGPNGTRIPTKMIKGVNRDLQDAFISGLKMRMPLAVFNDEGNHFAKVGSTKYRDQMDEIKYVADTTGKPFVIFGTYQMLSLIELSGQLDGRTEVVHLHRYGYRDAKDDKHFKSLLGTYQDHLVLKVKPQLTEHVDYFKRGSCGLPGLLKNWLSRALRRAYRDGEKKDFIHYCRQTAYPKKRIDSTMQKIVSGEKRIRGYIPDPDNIDDDSNNDNDQNAASSNGSGSKGPTRPGTPNPRRDPVDR